MSACPLPARRPSVCAKAEREKCLAFNAEIRDLFFFSFFFFLSPNLLHPEKEAACPKHWAHLRFLHSRLCAGRSGAAGLCSGLAGPAGLQAERPTAVPAHGLVCAFTSPPRVHKLLTFEREVPLVYLCQWFGSLKEFMREK